MAIYRNWPRIFRLKDPHLRTCALVTNEEEALRILEQGCPDLFCNQPMPVPSLPLSAIRQWQREHGFCDKGDVVVDGSAGHFSIPHLFFWDPNNEEFESSDIPLTLAFISTVPRPLLVGTQFIHEGRELIVLASSDVPGSKVGDDINYLTATLSIFIDPTC